MRWPFIKMAEINHKGNGVALANRAQRVMVYPHETTYGVAMDWKTRDYEGVYGSGDYGNVWVYACVQAIAQAVASIPFKFYSDSGKERKPLPQGHPLSKLFWGPNPHMTRLELWEAIMVYLELTGNCFLALEDMDGQGRPREIWPLRPDYIRILPDKKDKVGGYIFRASGEAVRYEPGEMLHIKRFNPTDNYWGLSPLSAARLGIIADYNAAKWNANFFKQGARPSGVLSTQEELNDSNFRRLKAEFEQSYAGAGRAHRMIVLEKGLQWQSTSITQKDMEFIEQRKLSREEILAVYKVPPIEVGVFEYANYANSEVQDKIFWTKCVIPRLSRIEEVLNTFLMPRFGDNIFGEFDLSRVEALRENEDLKMTIARKAVGNGLEPQIWTVDEARKRLWNLPPVSEVKKSEAQTLSLVSLGFEVEPLLGAIDDKELNDWLMGKAKVFHADTLRSWAVSELRRIKSPIDFQMANPRVIEFLQKQGATLVKHVNDTTKESIRKSVLEGVDKGETIPEIADRIKDVFAKATESRAFTIARTETVGASNFGALEAYHQSGVEGKGWVTAGDEKIRPSHVQAGRDYAEGIPIGDLFVVGGYQMERPGDSSHGADVGEVANCRCTVSPRVKLEKESLADQEILWNSFVLFLTPRERLFETTVAEFFGKQEAEILRRLQDE